MNIYRELCDLAVKAAETSYSPYSGFSVGAALLCADGSIYTGCNIENSSYSATNCAERVAFQNAVSDGKRDFVAIAIAGGREVIGERPLPPCGICRQVMAEFCDPDAFRVLIPSKKGVDEYLLRELLPLNFSKNDLY